MLCDNARDLSHVHSVNAPWYYVPFCLCPWFYVTIYFVIFNVIDTTRQDFVVSHNSTFLALRDDTFASDPIPRCNSTIRTFLSFIHSSILMRCSFKKSPMLRHKPFCSTQNLRCNAIYFFSSVSGRWCYTMIHFLLSQFFGETRLYVSVLVTIVCLFYCPWSLFLRSTFYDKTRAVKGRHKTFSFTQDLLCYEIFLFCLRSSVLRDKIYYFHSQVINTIWPSYDLPQVINAVPKYFCSASGLHHTQHFKAPLSPVLIPRYRAFLAGPFFDALQKHILFRSSIDTLSQCFWSITCSQMLCCDTFFFIHRFKALLMGHLSDPFIDGSPISHYDIRLSMTNVLFA